MLTVALLFLIPAQPAPVPTLEQLLDRLTEQRKATLDASAAEAATVEEIKARYKEMVERLTKFGILNGPNPGPVVPPVKPPVIDPLAVKLKQQFTAASGKKEDAQALAALYRAAADLCADNALTSSLDLLNRLREASSRMVGPGVLLPIRETVKEELAGALGPPTTDPLTAAQRKAATELFGRLAMILEGL